MLYISPLNKVSDHLESKLRRSRGMPIILINAFLFSIFCPNFSLWMRQDIETIAGIALIDHMSSER